MDQSHFRNAIIALLEHVITGMQDNVFSHHLAMQESKEEIY